MREENTVIQVLLFKTYLLLLHTGKFFIIYIWTIFLIDHKAMLKTISKNLLTLQRFTFYLQRYDLNELLSVSERKA